MRHRIPFSLIMFLVPAFGFSAGEVDSLRVPQGFEVTRFADSDRANDIYCLTVDPAGRVVVSGRGYVRVLEDRDGDGRADRVLDFAGAPRDGAMGLFWEGDTLYCMGDGGLRRWRDAHGKGRLRVPELIYPFRTGGEHHAHAIRRGPDGWLYVLCGNHTGIRSKHATVPTSAIHEPIAGCVLRFSPDFKRLEIVGDGFRNAYAMDFNSDGELFTYDSDNERCVSLPWYEHTRCYHVLPGGHHGWLSPQRTVTWRRPPSFVDVVAPLTPLLRGSPTGLVCYRHVQFPSKYRGGLFALDWTFGRIWFVPLRKKGSSYTTRPELFLRATGDNGFAPTGAAIHPRTGDLFVSIGGRGTRGGVYRIRYPAGMGKVTAEAVARLEPPSRSLGFDPKKVRVWLRQVKGVDLHLRRRALEMLWRHRRRITSQQIQKAIEANLDQDDRYLRQATARLVRTLSAEQRKELWQNNKGTCARITLALAQPTTAIHDQLRSKESSSTTRLEVARLLQLALGDLNHPRKKGTIWEGYSRRDQRIACPKEVLRSVQQSFPSGDRELDRELSRLLAMVEDSSDETVGKVTRRLTAQSHPVEDIHYLTVLGRLQGKRTSTVTRTTAGALLALDRKLKERRLRRDRNWPLRIAELHAELARKDEKLNEMLLAHPEFGRADHVLYTRRLSAKQRTQAAELLLKQASKDGDYDWNAEMIRLLGRLPASTTSPVLRRLWGEQGLDEVILSVLARHPETKDRPRFLESLGSARPRTVSQALAALEKLPLVGDREEVFQLLVALRKLPPGKAEVKLRRRLESRLQRATKQELHGVPSWMQWYQKEQPERARKLINPGSVDLTAWRKRLARVDWSQGEVKRGKKVYLRASCASCHTGTRRLGPDLHGVTSRFSRPDLFTAILEPNKEVPARYRTTYLVTRRGKAYRGMIIYEAVDSILLQTGPSTTVRLTNHQIQERRLTSSSLMPAGLLAKVSDRDLADLYAYLKSLGKKSSMR